MVEMRQDIRAMIDEAMHSAGFDRDADPRFLLRRHPQPILSAMSDQDSELTDAKIAAAEARTDTKFAQVLARLDAIEKSTAGVKTTVIATGIGAVGIVIAVFAYGSQMFGTGLDAQTIANSAASAVEERMNGRLTALEGQIGGIAAAIEASRPPTGEP